MKILYYSPHLNLSINDPAGYATHIREIISAFKYLGHDVLPVIMGDNNEAILSAKISHGFFKLFLKKIIPSYLWESLKDWQLLRIDNVFEKELEDKIRKFQPDLIYERANYLQLSGINIAKKFKIKHYLEVNSPLNEERMQLQGGSFFFHRAENYLKQQLQDTDKIITISSVLKIFFKDHYKIPERKIIVTPNAINPEHIETDDKEIEILKGQLSLNNKLVIGFCGSIFRWHGVDLLIDAFIKISKKYSHTILLIVGDGEIIKELKQKAMDSNANEKIIFTGSIPHKEIFNYLALMNITVMVKSNWYGSPIKIFEYGAMEKAIIAPDNLPIKEVMKDKEDGLLVLSEVDSLSDAIEKLIEDEKLRKRMANNFKRKVLSDHTWTLMAKRILTEE